MKKSSSLISFLAILIGIFVIFNLSRTAYREAKRSRQIQQEVESLKSEAEKIKRNNQELTEKISYFETPDFQEKIAKEKLNLQKENEQVIIIRPSYSEKEESQEQKEEVKINFNRESNYRKWWDYFFGYN